MNQPKVEGLIANLDLGVRVLQEAALHGNVTVIVIEADQPKATDLPDLLDKMDGWLGDLRREVMKRR